MLLYDGLLQYFPLTFKDHHIYFLQHFLHCGGMNFFVLDLPHWACHPSGKIYNLSWLSGYFLEQQTTEITSSQYRFFLACTNIKKIIGCFRHGNIRGKYSIFLKDAIRIKLLANDVNYQINIYFCTRLCYEAGTHNYQITFNTSSHGPS